MDRLAISMLGMPRVEYAGRPLAVDRRKAVALLIYLATTGGAHGRDALATLLWPGYDQSTARGNLRRTLSALHTALGEEWLAIDRDSVALHCGDDLWVDAAEFARFLAECRTHDHSADQVCPRCLAPLSQAVALYRDDFLTGFTLPDAPDFDDWQRYQTESLRGTLSGALERLAHCLAGQGDIHAALAHARRRVALDPLDESSQRQLMQTLAWAGDRGAALRQYGACVELLRREVQAAPAPETAALNAAISQNRLAPPVPFPQHEPLKTARQDFGELSRAVEDAGAPNLFGGLSGAAAGESSQSGELRPVTILCAGLAGEAEPEAAAAGLERLLASLETILKHYEARLDRLLGDSVAAVFGASRTHEDDAERAVAAGWALIEATRSAGISAGIATGEVYFGPVGAGQHAAVSVLGPMVNRAARLQGRAVAGQVLADRATQRQTRQAFHYRQMDEGGAAAYIVAGVQPRPAKTRGIEGLRAALIGRDEELAKLAAALARVRAGRGQIVALIGEAGLGKSRLVAELKELADLLPAASSSLVGKGDGGAGWLEGRCLEMAASTSYGPFVDLLRGYFGAAAAGDAPCGSATLACAVRDGLRAFQDAGLLTTEQVEEIGPLLGNLLSLRFGDDWDERLRMADPGQIRHRTFAALRAFFGALARRQPTALVLEDLHWADSLSLDLISELLGLLTDHPLLLLCVYRPGREYPSERLTAVAERRCRECYTELRLRALTTDESRQMLASLLTVEGACPEPVEGLPAKARELIVAQGEGNPFFTEEVVRSLIDAGQLYREDTHWRARDHIALAHAPEGVQTVILSRVDRLAAGDKQILQAASVLGRLFPLPVLARLVPPGLDVAAALDRLDERDFVYLERSWPEAEYSFKHVLTQEAIYGTLLVGRKTQLHRQAGAAMEARYADSLAEHYEALAQHYDRSDAGEKAVEYLLKAGEKARRAYLNDEAIGYFERALARCEQVAPVAGQGEGCASARLEALTGLGKVHFLVGRFVEAEGWLRKAISLGREIGVTPKELARLYFWVGDALYWQGRFREMAQLGEEGLALLGGEIESVEAVPLSYFIVIELRLTGEEERFWEGLSRIAEYIGRLPYCEELRSVHIGVAVLHALWRKDIKGGERWLDMIEGFSKRYHDDRALCEVLVQRSVFQFRTGDIQAALLTDAQALAKCLQIGDTPSGVAAYELLCAHHLALGRLAEAEIWARRSLEDPIAANDPGRAPWAPITQSIVRVCDGDDPGALVSAQEISELLPRLNSYRRFLASTLLAGIYLALGQRAEARALYAALFRDVRPALVCGWSRRGSLRPLLPALLVGLEAVYEDPLAFRAFCRDYRAQHPEVATLSLRQWYGEPAAAGPIPSAPRFNCEFACETVESLLAVGWRWHDPCGDGAFGLQQGAGLALCAANGRDLFYINQTAPRWVRPAGGDFVAEVVCLAVDDRPAMGGLLVWRDRENYLLVEWGRYGRRETLFAGCVANVDMDYGRGCLSGQPAKVYLRLARRGGRVDALCSADGETWWSVGHAAFPADDPVQIGVCAIGMIDRTIYPGAYREGTAIRFEVLRVW